MKKHLSVRYGTIQGCYWMGYAALMGYASVYLLEKGFTNTQIGLLTAVGCIVSAVLQPALASYADRPESPSVRTMLLGANLMQLVLIISLAAKLHFLFQIIIKQERISLGIGNDKHYDADADDSVR